MGKNQPEYKEEKEGSTYMVEKPAGGIWLSRMRMDSREEYSRENIGIWVVLVNRES